MGDDSCDRRHCLSAGFSLFIFWDYPQQPQRPAAAESAWTEEKLLVSVQPAEPALPRDDSASHGFVNTCRKCQSHARAGER